MKKNEFLNKSENNANLFEINNKEVFFNEALKFIDLIFLNLKLKESIFDKKIWISDEIHGLGHSFRVYRKMIDIAKKENLKINFYNLFLLSIFHDLYEFLPLLGINGLSLSQEKKQILFNGLREKVWKEQNHHTLIALSVRIIGAKLKIDKKLVSQLARDLYHHDDFWARPAKNLVEKFSKNTSNEGKLLSDADRLVNDESKLSEGESILLSIKRTMQYGLGREYFIRDINIYERRKWTKRSGGFFDTLTPLLFEFYAPDYLLLTKTGKAEYNKKKKFFYDELILFLKQYHKDQMNIITSLFSSQKEIFFGIKGENELQKIKANSLKELCKKIMTKSVSKLSSNNREYYGYSIIIGENFIDPSIVQFENFSELEIKIKEIVSNFSTNL